VSDVSVHVVTPTRGDRPRVFDAMNALYIAWQDYPVQEHWRVAYPPLGEQPDLVPRVRHGMRQALESGAELVLIMEDDDYYSPSYVRRMVEEWEGAGRPPALVSMDAWRYHLATRNWGHIREDKRRPALFVSGFSAQPPSWPQDDHVFLDDYLARSVPGLHRFMLPDWEAIGIKHGLGLCGGNQHWLMAQDTWPGESDTDGGLLRSVIGEPLAMTYLRLGDAIRDGAYGVQKAQRRMWLQKD